MGKKNYQSPRIWQSQEPEPIKKLAEINKMNLVPPDTILKQYQTGILLLQRIFEALPNEYAGYPDNLPASFFSVEQEIANCISGCLYNSEMLNSHVGYIRSLLRDYKVVRYVHMKSPTVSLHRCHMLLKDNYPDSFLCKLLNIFLDGHLGVSTKTIDF